ncbi:Repressible alkaline phosphatase [Wickerhamiella sorbophila]|uniref:Alkaline phosphatase n=1 Tax=Wickerhamiella sorbophila TaxID=45607 RepID=A0A2T0FN70_9ASCO|nr:Repressible alkaline phosphatase [Wickerhamiella sorbophila]PRT56443.1 Repressible alkaline phosphatase [Wickerhamiella sorbophila]
MSKHHVGPSQRPSWLPSILFVWACVASGFSFYLLYLKPMAPPSQDARLPTVIEEPSGAEAATTRKRNLIFMVSDGMGPASLSMARNFQDYVEESDIGTTLFLDDHFLGNSRTKSDSSLITDSAAGATAFSCGLKTYNGAIGVDPDSKPCGTVIEAAKEAGYLTGMVVTTFITDATPASFSTHAYDRSEQQTIAAQLVGRDHLLGRNVDLLIGGGRCEFLPRSMGGCREDSRDLLKEATEDGWSLATNRKEFDYLQGGRNVSLPLMALVSNGQIPFDIDRDDEQYPSLVETTKTAIRALSDATKDSDKGFVLMIEGSRIDHAGHLNDPGAQVYEVLAYDAAYKAAVEFASSADVETVVISTSDHETGGLTVGRQVTEEYPEYVWYPEVLASVERSTEHLARRLRNYQPKSSEKRRHEMVKYIKHEILGPKGLNLSEIHRDDIRRVIHNRKNAQDVLSEILSVRAQIGWSTHGHTAVDVNVYGYAKDVSRLDVLRGGNENIEFATFVSEYLDLDLGVITDKLHSKLSNQTGADSFNEPQEPGHLDAYHTGVSGFPV